MRKFGKALAIAGVVAAIGGIGLAIAQPAGPGFGPGFGPGWMHGRGGPGFMMGGPGGYGFGDPAARLAAVKTELGIRAEQEPVWDAYTKAVQDAAATMRTLHEGIDFDSLRAMNWQEHQAFMAKMFDARSEAYKSVQASATKLVAALDDNQKTHAVLPGLLGSGGPGFGMMGGGGGPHMGWGGPGGGMMGWGGGPGMMGPGYGPWGGSR